MSIPFTRKLSVLGRINHTPITALDPGSQGLANRGAVIAVEGPKPRMLKQVGQLVEKAIMASNEVNLKTWGREPEEPNNNERRDSPSEGASADEKDTFKSCFETMIHWHRNSRDIVKHITNKDDSTLDSNKEDTGSQGSRGGSAEESAVEPQEKGPAPKVPVALIKEGFSLTLSDAFACTVPIADSYAPIDHWQWMATLWRGTIAPDLVVYVKPSVDEEIAKFGAVEFHKHPCLMTVRIAVGKDLDEATERRVAFEVVEWVRGGSFRGESSKA